VLAETGCLFILAAVESMDDDILRLLDKGHTRQDFINALAFLREAGISLAPTFVAFTPWTTLGIYIELLEQIVSLGLIASVAPVQLSIRLLIPAGSYILQLDGLDNVVGDFSAGILGHPWSHPDSRVDRLQQDIQTWVSCAETEGLGRADTFEEIWRLAHEAAGKPVPELAVADAGSPVPRLSENWYCCAEPTCEQLVSF
jgi:hypothetical protein